MSCITKEDLINSLKNHKALFKTSESDSVQDLVDRLDLVQSAFVKDDTGYKVEGTTVGVSKSVTQQAGKLDKRKFNPTADDAKV